MRQEVSAASAARIVSAALEFQRPRLPARNGKSGPAMDLLNNPLSHLLRLFNPSLPLSPVRVRTYSVSLLRHIFLVLHQELVEGQFLGDRPLLRQPAYRPTQKLYEDGLGCVIEQLFSGFKGLLGNGNGASPIPCRMMSACP